MKLIPISGNMSIIKIHRVRVRLTDLPWHLVSPTPTTFIIQHNWTISRLEYIQEIPISEILHYIQKIQISQVSKCSSLWIPHLFRYTHNKYWTKNKTSTATWKKKILLWRKMSGNWSFTLILRNGPGSATYNAHTTTILSVWIWMQGTYTSWVKKSTSVMSRTDSCLNNAKWPLMQQLTL